MQKTKGRKVILPIVLILLSAIIISVSTFAFIQTYLNRDSGVQFSKVQLSANTNVGDNREIGMIMQGKPILDERVAVSKAVDSANIYIRVKLSFYTTANNAQMTALVGKLQAATASDFNIITTQIGTTGAKWNKGADGYYYLVSNSSTSTLFNVTDATEYKFSDSLTMPTGLIEGKFNSEADDYVYDDYPIFMELAFEAIQSQGVLPNVNTADDIFNELFPND